MLPADDGTRFWGEAFSPDRQTGAGAVGSVIIDPRDVIDIQLALAPDDRTVADGSPTSSTVYLWTPP
jgi:hypothetical protein